MGSYDCVCMVTGVSLRPLDAAAVLLQQDSPSSWSPIALPVFGAYAEGGVWSITEDANTELIVNYFAAQLGTGRFAAKDYTTVAPTLWPEFPSADYFSVIDGLFGLVERNTTMWSHLHDPEAPLVTIDGKPVLLSLIAIPVWDAIVGTSGTGDDPGEPLPEELRGTVAEQIYAGEHRQIASALKAFAVVNAFLAAHEISWTPPAFGRYTDNYGQHYEQMDEYLARARSDWSGNAAINVALDRVAHSIAELHREWDAAEEFRKK